jgi:predicted AlkP superfamily phosphohydrolase/phosphomutase
MNSKTRVVLIGIDAAVPTLIKKFFATDKLHNMKKLASQGTWAECIPVFPTHTASNWNTVSTGAWPKTHGVTDMVVHLPGTPLTEYRSGFFSDLCKAEHIWETAERFEKKCILLKFIASWPPTIKKSIQVEGFGAPGGPGSRPWGSSPLSISNSACYCNKPLDNATIVKFSDARLSEWKDIPSKSSSLPPLESEMRVGSIGGVMYNLLLFAFDSKEYDTILIAKNKNGKNGILLKKDQHSNWQVEDFRVEDAITKATFRMKLIDVGGFAKGQEVFKLFVTQVFPVEGWTFPKSLSKELGEKFGPFLESISHFPYVFGWIDEKTYLEDVEYQADWMGKATPYLMSNNDWDLYMTQWHGIDNTQHAFLRFDKSVLTKQNAEICDNVVLKTYEIADKLVGDIFNGINQSKEKDTYTFVLSDHGHVMGKRRFFINAYLYQKGLIKLKNDPATNKITVDWENTRAFSQGMVHVYVNLKGRDPKGSVLPGKDYENVVREVTDALYEIKDPKNGIRPISLALSNQDAEFLGLSGERAGDVIYATNPIYASDNRLKVTGDLFEDLKVGFPDASIHGSQLPSVDMGDNGTIKSMFIAHGPKIRKGYVREKPVHMIDIAPTIAHILNMPPPKNSEGSILHDIFE